MCVPKTKKKTRVVGLTAHLLIQFSFWFLPQQRVNEGQEGAKPQQSLPAGIRHESRQLSR